MLWWVKQNHKVWMAGGFCAWLKLQYFMPSPKKSLNPKLTPHPKCILCETVVGRAMGTVRSPWQPSQQLPGDCSRSLPWIYPCVNSCRPFLRCQRQSQEVRTECQSQEWFEWWPLQAKEAKNRDEDSPRGKQSTAALQPWPWAPRLKGDLTVSHRLCSWFHKFIDILVGRDPGMFPLQASHSEWCYQQN